MAQLSALRSQLLVAVLFQIGAHAAMVSLAADFGAPLVSTWMGVGGVRHGYDYMPENTYRGMTSAYRAISHQRMAEARLRIARSWYEAQWVMPLGWGKPMFFNTSRFDQFCQWAADMQRINVSVQINTGWWFTGGVCSYGYPSAPSCQPTEADVAYFSAWISGSVRELVVNRGLTNVDTIVLFTEPMATNSTGNPPPGGNWTMVGYYYHVVRAVHDRLLADGLRHLVRIQAPNVDAISLPDRQALLAGVVAADAADGIIDMYSAHSYGATSYGSWLQQLSNAVNITRPRAKPFMVDEGGMSNEAYRNGSDYGTYLAIMHAAAANAGASAVTSWLWEDQYYAWPVSNTTNADSFYNGLQRWGTSGWLPYTTAVRPSRYVLAALARYFGPEPGAAVAATVRVSPSAGGVIIAALAGAGVCGVRSVLLINENAAGVNITVAVNLTRYGACAPPLHRYFYDPAAPPQDGQMLRPSAEFAGAGLTALNDTLPPRSVVLWSNQEPPLPSAAPTPTPSASASASPVPSASVSGSVSSTVSVSCSASAAASPSSSASPSASASSSPSHSSSASLSSSASGSATGAPASPSAPQSAGASSSQSAGASTSQSAGAPSRSAGASVPADAASQSATNVPASNAASPSPSAAATLSSSGVAGAGGGGVSGLGGGSPRAADPSLAGGTVAQGASGQAAQGAGAEASSTAAAVGVGTAVFACVALLAALAVRAHSRRAELRRQLQGPGGSAWSESALSAADRGAATAVANPLQLGAGRRR